MLKKMPHSLTKFGPWHPLPLFSPFLSPHPSLFTEKVPKLWRDCSKTFISTVALAHAEDEPNAFQIRNWFCQRFSQFLKHRWCRMTQNTVTSQEYAEAITVVNVPIDLLSYLFTKRCKERTSSSFFFVLWRRKKNRTQQRSQRKAIGIRWRQTLQRRLLFQRIDCKLLGPFQSENIST